MPKVVRIDAFKEERQEKKQKLVIIEIGAGTHIPIVRYESEYTAVELNFCSTDYRAIADALVQLKALIDKDAFILKVQSLKNTYKRRRNFMAILEQRFGWL